MANNRRWWMIVLAVLTTALLTGCFRGAPKIPLQPFLSLIAPYPGATNVHPDHLSLFWGVEYREAKAQNGETLASRETPSIEYEIFFAQSDEDFGDPERIFGGENVFFRIERVVLDFQREYRWKITAHLLDGRSLHSEEATFTTRPSGVMSLTPPEMVMVQRGIFLMGDEVGDLPDWADARPLHTVTLNYDYWIGKYEVTFDEYDAFCDATGRSKPEDRWGWGRGTRPVICISWWDALAYCNWLSVQSELAPAYDSNGNLMDKNGQITHNIAQVEGYRLPTEAEWEYAASGGHKATAPRFLYAGSDNIDEVAWYNGVSNSDRAERKTQPVGGKDPNELGLHDMSGNVWEWCHDRYTYYTSTPETNPTGPSSGSYRVTRGGSWNYSAQFSRVANRLFAAPHCIDIDLGFRLARTHF